jgi:acetyl esterase
MPLEPKAAEIVEMMAGNGGRRLADLSPEEARAQVRRLARFASIARRPVEHEERRIGAAGHQVEVRTYRPRGHEDAHALPLLVFAHGGGWVMGDLDLHEPRVASLVEQVGCVVVAVDYRLAPDNKWPAAAEDTYATLLWAAENARDLGADPDRIAIAGDSAGGNLAAVATLRARDEWGPRVSAQVLTCPILAREFDSPSMRDPACGCILEPDDLRWCWRQYLPNDEAAHHPHASPLLAEDLSGLPPTLLITAEFDALRDQGAAYAARLEDAGVPTTLRRHDGVFHAFSDWEDLEAAGDALATTADFLHAAWRV